MPGWLARPGRRDAVGDDRAGAAGGGAADHLPVRGGKRGRYIFLAGGRQRADGPRKMVTVPVFGPVSARVLVSACAGRAGAASLAGRSAEGACRTGATWRR